METTVRLSGKPVYIVYRNDVTFYTVMRFLLLDESEKVITCTGILPSVPETDIRYNIYGNYVEHPRFGMQFQIESLEKPLPSEEEGIIRYLSGTQFPGIGKKTAEKIVKKLGESCLQIIRDNPDILKTIGLKEDKINIISEGLREEDDGLSELVRFLNVHGIGMRNLVRLNRAYGKDALRKIQENPYRVIEECDGFGFKTADRIAESLGFSKDDERRLYAYLISLCMDLCMASGDSYVMNTVLEEHFRKDLSGIEADYDALLDAALKNRRLIMEEGRIYPKSQYDAECYTASFLQMFPWFDIDPFDEELMHGYLNRMQEEYGIQYDETQINAVEKFFDYPFLIVTGGPGTGKTTLVRALVTLFKLLYPSSTVMCTAPTGRAAKRLAEVTDNQAVTVHSLLKWDLESNTFGKNEDDPIEADLLIIDEFSMVDIHLFANLLKACRRVRRICVIGDEDQLPSVSPGSVLRDLIASEQFPLVRLNHIYRQKEGSDVINLAHMIHSGEADFLKFSHDVAFFECSRFEVKENVLKIVQWALDKGYSMNDIQVLAPIYSGPCGIDVLNNALQEAFNPYDRRKKQMRVGYITFRTGDKILQLKNQPDDDVYNGDIGMLEEIYTAEETENHQPVIVVNFDGIYVEYNPDNFKNITLAYCISVHKSQGSEYPIVVMPVTYQYSIMLQRKLLYTGVTRARQSLVLLGEKGAFIKGIQTLERHVRATTLRQRIQKSMSDDVLPDS